MTDFYRREAVKSVGANIDVDGAKVHVTFREGATPDMLAHVILVYRVVSAALAAGVLKLDEDTRAFVPEYDVNKHRPHGQARVALWGSASYQGWPVDLHVITEYTSAQDVLNSIVDMGKGIKDGLALPLPESIQTLAAKAAPPRNVTPGSPLANTPEEFEQHAAANGGRVDLAQQFPRPAAPAQPAPKAKEDSTETPLIAQFSYKDQDQYEAAYTGQTVAVAVGRIMRAVQAKKDGTGAYEVYQVFPANSQYEAYTLNTFVPAADDKRRDWKVFKQLEAAMPKPGAAIQGDIVLTYKLNKSGDKVYWNITGLQYDPATTDSVADEPSPAEDDMSRIPF